MTGRGSAMSFKSGLFALALGCMLFVGSSFADDKDVKLDNPKPGKCPVSNKKIDPTITLKIDDKTYAFCCEKCEAKFKEHPEKYLKNAPK